MPPCGPPVFRSVLSRVTPGAVSMSKLAPEYRAKAPTPMPIRWSVVIKYVPYVGDSKRYFLAEE